MITDEEAQRLAQNGFYPKDDFGVICVKITRLIKKDRFDHFLERIKKCYTRFQELRVLVYYEHFDGWDGEAFWNEAFSLEFYGPYITRLAFINPPEDEFNRHMLCTTLNEDAIRSFTKSEIEEAMFWVQN